MCWNGSADLRTIAITCADGQALEAECSLTLKLLDADEQSTVMTRSFTSMLLGLQYLAATIAADERSQRALMDLPAQVAPLLEDRPATRLRAFVETHSFRIVFFWRRDRCSALHPNAC